MITSTIAKGRVKSINVDALMKMPGVIAVLTPQNAPKLAGREPECAGGAAAARRRCACRRCCRTTWSTTTASRSVSSSRTRSSTRPRRRWPRRSSYVEAAPALDISKEPKIPPEQVQPLGGERSYKRGDVDAGLASAAARVEHTYTTPLENHNPMEVHNTIACVGRRQAHRLRLDAGHLQRAQHARADVRHSDARTCASSRTSPAAASAARAARGRTRCSPRWRRSRSDGR